jgi:YVTN family beta-propeller protein
VVLMALLPALHPVVPLVPQAQAAEPAEPDRSPVDVVLTPDEKYLLTANQTSHSVSLVETASGKVMQEIAVGQRPSALALTPDARQVLVSGTFSGDLTLLALKDGKLEKLAAVQLGFEPRGIAVSADGSLAYVALTSAHQVAVVDLAKRAVVERIAVGRWPRYIALSPDGKRLAVGVSGDGGVAVIDTTTRKQVFVESFGALNLGQMQITKDGLHVYVPWVRYRGNPIGAGSIRLGWVFGNRLARVRLDRKSPQESISLDAAGEAVADPHGLALSPDEQWLAATASGSHELLMYKVPGLPFPYAGDLIDYELASNSERFWRVPLGGRPMALRYSRDGRRVYVANYLLNAVQVVAPHERKVTATISLGGPKETTLARKGEAIFYDGSRSFDQWFSCHTCHYEGHTNSVAMDTNNDGDSGTFKTVLSLRNVTHTGPWTWHGWQKDLKAAMLKSLTDTLQTATEPTDDDARALIAFCATLAPPQNPFRKPDGGLTERALRGKEVFAGDKARCDRCHAGPYLTDGKIHDVGLGSPADLYKGFNTPSLVGVYDRILYLHDGRARTLEEVLKGAHAPEKVTRQGALTAEELEDLIAYLRSL